jgi:anti-sigma factor RsiW
MTTPTPTTTPVHGSRLLVHAYLDGELDTANALAIEQQIDADPTLAAQLASYAALQKTLRAQFPRERVPPHLQMRINAAIGPGRRWIRPTWSALAASVVLAVALSSGSTWLALRAPQSDLLINEVVDDHMRALMASKPTDVNSSERHTVKPWFNGRISQSPRVVDLSSKGFPLIGARIDVVATNPVPTIVYGRRLHIISLSEIPVATGPVDPTLRRSINGFNVVSWRTDRTTYWATSDLNARELEMFARLFQAAAD